MRLCTEDEKHRDFHFRRVVADYGGTYEFARQHLRTEADVYNRLPCDARSAHVDAFEPIGEAASRVIEKIKGA